MIQFRTHVMKLGVARRKMLGANWNLLGALQSLQIPPCKLNFVYGAQNCRINTNCHDWGGKTQVWNGTGEEIALESNLVFPRDAWLLILGAIEMINKQSLAVISGWLLARSVSLILFCCLHHIAEHMTINSIGPWTTKRRANIVRPL